MSGQTGQRPRNQQPFVQAEDNYRFKGDKDLNIRPHEQCEMEQPKHRVRPDRWPPHATASTDLYPTMPARCIDCGVHIALEERHATGELPGVEVILPQSPTPTRVA